MKFNEALLKINLAVLTEYPSAEFYEALGHLTHTENIGGGADRTIDTSHFKVVYDYFDNNKQKTIIANFNDDLTIGIKIVDDIWRENWTWNL